MRYVVRTFLGMGLFAFCWVFFGRSLYELLDIGTCASGGPYVVAQECPGGTGCLAGALVGSIFGMFFALVPYLSRGTPPNAPPPANAWVIVWFWTGIFWSMALGCFLAVWGPEADPGPGAKGAGIGVGIMGLLFGAGGFWAVTANRRSARAGATAGRPRPTVAPTRSRRPCTQPES